MAPDSRFWRHQLGKATTYRRRKSLNASLPILVLLFVFTSNAQARIEPLEEAWNNLSSLRLYESASDFENPLISSLSPPFVTFYSLPAFSAGQSNKRNQIHIPDHPSIQKYVHAYKGKERETFLKALERSWSYVPIMIEILESYDVPAELVYIPLVESRFQGKASFKGAGGYWQLLAGTARKLGLRVDRWVDERMDPIKSTHAAAKYLRSFYDQLQSWPLALASYNAGGGPVMSAMRRCRTANYWELVQRGSLPGRTGSYVAKIYAAIQIIRDLESHGFDRPSAYRLYDFESTSVGSPLNLGQIAKWLGVEVSDMRELNPSLRLDQLPPNTEFDLRLPSGGRDKFDVAYAGYLGR